LLAAERLAAACAHFVLCNSESLRAEALSLRIAPAAKLLLLGAGSSRGGRLTRDKGLPELVDAFDTILLAEPNSHLLLVGWFDESEDLLGRHVRSHIESHPRIHLTGHVEDPSPYYRAMDVMVLPSWREGFPNVVLEASATGIPVITTFTTGSRDSVVPEVTGLLIPPGYPNAISEAVLKLLRNPELRLRMGKAARAWVHENYADELVLSSAATYYKSLLATALG